MGRDAFNLVEGTDDHHLRGSLHVSETATVEQWMWRDLAFLARNAAVMAGGWP